MYKKLLTLLCAVLFGINLFATTFITIGEGATTNSYVLPITIDGAYGPKYSISQQIYLASELMAEGASEGDITAIKFYYSHADNVTNTRSLEVWMMETSLSEFSMTADNPGNLVCNSCYKAGVKVFDGSVELHKDDYTITFNRNGNRFHWGGSNNILLTVYDKTGTGLARQRHVLMATSSPRFLHKKSSATPLTDWDINDLYNTPADSYKSSSSEITGHKWVNKITFTFEDSFIPSPTSPSSSDVTGSSALIGWTAAADADSYEVRWGHTICDLEEATPVNVGNVTSYTISGLEASTKYYYQIRTKIGSAYSAWTDEANFTTTAHIHDAITYEKWTWTNILPTAAGNYYLTNDVTLSSNWEPLGSINLCLNGHRVFFGSNYGIIDDGQTIAIHDYDGNGYMMSSNHTQTLLVSGASTNVFVDRDELILNNAGGRKIVVTENGYASIIYPLTFDDDADNTVHFNEYAGLHITVQLNRAFLTGSCNTICLPFEVSSAILDYIFGVNHVLRLDNSEYYPATQELSLNFVNASTLQAGVPYLIQPTQDCSNPEISGVISVNAPSSIETDFIDFNGVLTPTVLEQGNHNLLCVGAGNELFWPNTSNAMKSFRAYFEVKGAARNAVRARIVKGEQSTEDINSIQDNSGKACKRIIDGQFLIEKNGILYNAQGARIQ